MKQLFLFCVLFLFACQKDKINTNSTHNQLGKITQKVNQELIVTPQETEVEKDTVLVSYFDGSKIIKREGTFIQNSYGLRKGLGKEYYQDGQISSKGNYNYHFFYTCSGAIGTRSSYNYKVGPWEYWYENGQLKAKGAYKIKSATLNSKTGPNKVLFGELDETWTYWRENGEAFIPNKDFKKEFRYIIQEGGEYFYYLEDDVVKSGLTEEDK